MNLNYFDLLKDFPNALSEYKNFYSFLTERHLQAIWLEQKYFKNLQTSNSEYVKVLSPGIWNAEAGPDFLKAHLIIGNQEYRGDIEIHLVDESWTQHQHHTDSRYDQVIFHLSFWKPKFPKNLVTSKGTQFPCCHLEDFLTIPLARILRLIDLDLYPYKKFVGSGKCASTLFNTLSESKIKMLLQSAAHWRLIQKKNHLTTENEYPLLTGIAIALGYKHNSDAFKKLFSTLLPLRHLKEEELLALGLGICKFFTEEAPKKWASSPRYQDLKAIYEHRFQNNDIFIALTTHQIRPLNHPIRRLVYLIKMLVDPSLTSLYRTLENAWQESWESLSTVKSCRIVEQKIKDVIPSYQDPYWNSHYMFEEHPKNTFLTLIGDDLKNQIVINTFLPMLYGGIHERAHALEMQAFHIFYQSLSKGVSRKTKYLIHRFFGDTAKGKLINNAYMEQGAFQIHKDFCIHFEASCEGCPFVDRYKNLVE